MPHFQNLGSEYGAGSGRHDFSLWPTPLATLKFIARQNPSNISRSAPHGCFNILESERMQRENVCTWEGPIDENAWIPYLFPWTFLRGSNFIAQRMDGRSEYSYTSVTRIRGLSGPAKHR